MNFSPKYRRADGAQNTFTVAFSHAHWGHLGVTKSGPLTAEALELIQLVSEAVHDEKLTLTNVTRINDGITPDTKQYGSTPKDRILNVLKQRLNMETNEPDQNTQA